MSEIYQFSQNQIMAFNIKSSIFNAQSIFFGEKWGMVFFNNK